MDPTRDPTTDPTRYPTESPIHSGCEIGFELDVAFIVDHSCGFTADLCEIYMDGVFELISSIKGYNTPRVTVIDTTSPSVLVDLTDIRFNELTVNFEDRYVVDMDPFQEIIRSNQCNFGDVTEPELSAAINLAITEFQNSLGTNRHRKIVIVSSCKVDDPSVICNAYQSGIFIDGSEVEVTVINIVNNQNTDPTFVSSPYPITNAEAGSYLVCLTENDPFRSYQVPNIDHDDIQYIIQEFWTEICEQPTKDPTSDPTVDPTRDPTTDPTIDPTRDPTSDPTKDPTYDPTVDPTRDPTTDPTADPTRDPTIDPTIDPTRDPTTDPTVDPTRDPTSDPTIDPTRDPTSDPTIDPTRDPTVDPTRDPTKDPTIDPTRDPTTDPTM